MPFDNILANYQLYSLFTYGVLFSFVAEAETKKTKLKDWGNRDSFCDMWLIHLTLIHISVLQKNIMSSTKNVYSLPMYTRMLAEFTPVQILIRNTGEENGSNLNSFGPSEAYMRQ